jgi:hypothetical protein
MFSTDNKLKKAVRIIIDIVNVVIGVATVVFAVLTFLNTTENAWMFPIIFLLGGVMNLITGIKHLMWDRKVNGIILLVIATLLIGVAYATYVAVGGV